MKVSLGKYLLIGLICIADLAFSMESKLSLNNSKNLYPAVQQINGNLYKAKIPHKNLWMVMERVDSRTQPL